MATLTDTWTAGPSFDDGDDLDGSVLRTILDNIEAAVNSVDDSQIPTGADIDAAKLLDGSITAAKYGNTSIQHGKLLFADATNGVKTLLTAAPQRKIIVGTSAFDLASANNDPVAVDFSTDGHDSPTDFANTTDLTVICTLEYTSGGGDLLFHEISSLATTGFTCTVRTDDGAASSDTGTIHWIAIGRTA